MATYDFECFRCRYRHINHLRCFECKKCESTHLGATCAICNEGVFNDEAVLAEHDKEHINMKEFDLRPFEVKKYPETLMMFHCPYTKMDVRYKNLSQLSDLIQDASVRLVNDNKETEFHISIKKSLIHKEWQWEDIQVGWIFKIGEEEEAFFVKINECTISGFELEDNRIYIWKNNYSKDKFLLKKFTITKVYNCQELARMLMIERIIT